MIALRLMAVKIPLVVTVFMAAVAMFVERVHPVPGGPDQASRRPAAIYLDDLASSLVDPWSVRTSGRRSTSSTGRARPMPELTETVVALADGRVLASSDPRAHPSLSARLPRS